MPTRQIDHSPTHLIYRRRRLPDHISSVATPDRLWLSNFFIAIVTLGTTDIVMRQHVLHATDRELLHISALCETLFMLRRGLFLRLYGLLCPFLLYPPLAFFKLARAPPQCSHSTSFWTSTQAPSLAASPPTWRRIQ
ncbi:hypothetical protein DFH94DRAFT_185793 [Russula ochroleuca]|uniref:Uncharacterized protein n=1 Tax=Russula ochroleuca TaxID=152965 RepID=A0A9P5JZI4_9AGAM|nr:hypothetical protein DFH94DRAFT_185707 [Russula ochroleuca]KAF8472322.1 hypothetical protein DFH94DRAFT_185793 [Russula ochroleuca]